VFSFTFIFKSLSYNANVINHKEVLMAQSNKNGSTTSAPASDAAQANREDAKGTTTNPETTINTKNAEKSGKGPVHPLTAGAAKSDSAPTQGARQGASGPVTDSAKVEQQTDPNAGMGPMPIGVVPDGVEKMNYLNQAFSNIENVIQQVEGLLAASYDINGLRRHLYGARDWLAKELGLEKTDQGYYRQNMGGAASPSLMGQTTAQQETSQANKSTKAKTGSSNKATDSSQGRRAPGLKEGYSDKDDKKTSNPVTVGATSDSTSAAKDAKKGGNQPS
jgi:hypothetical protein